MVRIVNLARLLLVLLVHVLLLTNTKFTLWPEMMVYPYLLNNGFLLYRDIINPYPPTLIYALSQLTKFFGYNPKALQVFTWLAVIIVDLSIYIVAKKLTKNNQKALLTTYVFVILSIPFGINGLWFDLIQTPFIIFSFYFFYDFNHMGNKKSLFFSILILTIAIFIKQHLVSIGLFYIVASAAKYKEKIVAFTKFIPVLLIPFFLIFIFQVIFFSAKGTVEEYLFWVFAFPFFKASQMPGYILLPTVKQLVIVASLGAFFASILISKSSRNQLLPLAFGMFLLVLAFPRFDYFHLIPALSILVLLTPQVRENFLKAKLPIKLLFFLPLIPMIIFTRHYLISNWNTEIRFFESRTVSVATFLQITGIASQPLYIQNGPDQLFPLAQALPPKPWADEFPWYLEIGSVQERIVTSLKEHNPQFIITKPYDQGETYELGVYRPQKIADFVDENYQNYFQISDTLWLKIHK